MIRLGQLRAFLGDRKNHPLYLVSALVSLTLLAALVIYSGAGRLLQTLTRFDPAVFVYVLLIFLALVFIVAWRLKLALRHTGNGSFYQCLDISIFHIILLSLLPARLGDVCYPFILRQNLSIDLSRALSNLLVIRLYDLLVVCLLFVTAVGVNSAHIRASGYLITLTGLLLLSIVLLLSAGRWFLDRRMPPGEKSDVKSRFVNMIHQTRQSMSEYDVRDHVLLFVMTLLRWFAACLLFLCIFRGLQIELTLAQAALVTTGINLAVLIPVQTMGGFGVTEAVLAWVLGLFGYAAEIAISLALASRIIWLVFPVIIGITWIALRKTAAGRQADP
jgi:uncharacterized protein (TIRG00374 family)